MMTSTEGSAHAAQGGGMVRADEARGERAREDELFGVVVALELEADGFGGCVFLACLRGIKGMYQGEVDR